jgi:glycosyltransferase involved in cell wall biosynthesis
MVNQYASAPDMPGGQRHFELACLLLDNEWETTIAATPFSHRVSSFIRDVGVLHPFLTEKSDGVTFRWVYSLPYSGNGIRRYANMLSFALGMLPATIRMERPHVVVGSSPHLLAALSAWVISVRYRVPFLLEIRDLWPDTLVQMGLTNPVIIKPLGLIERFLYRRARLIFVLTEGIGHGVETKGVGREKIVFLPNASMRPMQIDDTERERTRREYGWGDQVIVMYAGAHGPANDLGQVVSAARELARETSIRFVFVGDGPTKHHVMEQAAGLINVSFLDPVPKSEVFQLMRAADIGILSLRQTKVFEGARPNKLFDYMASGLPVVSTIGGEVAKVLDEAGAGIYADPEYLAPELRDIALDPEKRARLGRNGLEYVSKTLTREDSAEKLANLLHMVVSHSK